MPITEVGQIDVTYEGVEANQIFLEPVFFDDDLLSSYRVMPNVVTRKKMQFARKLEKIVRKYAGCGFRPIGGLNVYDREIEVQKMKINLELCFDEFTDTVFEELLNKGTRYTDLTGTIVEDLLILRVQQALRLDLERIYHFGNTSSVDPDYDQMDGLWTVHYPALVTANLVPYVDTGSGAALSAGDGIDHIRTVYDNAPNELKALPQNLKVFNVTGSVFMQYREDIENGGGGDYGIIQMIEGVERLTFRGIPVMPQWRWDDIEANDLATSDAHLIEFTTPLNKVLATDLINPGSDFMIWYDPKDEKVYVKANWKMGGDYVHHSLISVGY